MEKQIEYNSDVALHAALEYKKGKVRIEECIPEHLEVENEYEFMKKGHWTYEKGKNITLLEMKEGEVLFDLRASILIEDVTYLVEEEQSYTRVRYMVTEILSH